MPKSSKQQAKEQKEAGNNHAVVEELPLLSVSLTQIKQLPAENSGSNNSNNNHAMLFPRCSSIKSINSRSRRLWAMAGLLVVAVLTSVLDHREIKDMLNSATAYATEYTTDTSGRSRKSISTSYDRIKGSYINSTGTGTATIDSSTAITAETTTETINPPIAIDPALQLAALQFVLERKTAYEQLRLRHWGMRGVGYLYTEHQMVLAATLPSEQSLQTRGTKEVVITNVYDAQASNATTNHSDNTNINCELWTIWVRVMGPEIFAGSAQALRSSSSSLSSSCHWVFPFDLQQPGKYEIDAKVLLYNAKGEFTEQMMCPFINGDMPPEIETQYPQKSAFRGFKLYIPQFSCCELCSRQPGCRYWASPPQNLPDPSFGTNGCEFRYTRAFLTDQLPQSFLLGDIEVDYTIPKRRRLDVQHMHGPAHGQSTAYFAGCGWSQIYALDFPCLQADTDDIIFLAQDTFDFSPTKPENSDAPQPLPLCTLKEETMDNSRGRWVQEPWPSMDQCPNDPSANEKFSAQFEIASFEPNHPHCWHRDDISQIGLRCLEMNCRFIQEPSKMKTRLKRQRQWNGVWRQYGCDYTEYTNGQLQRCISTKQITSFDTHGRSVSAMIQNYLDLRLDPLQLHNATTSSGGGSTKKVTISTLGLLHKTSAPDALLAIPELEAMPVVPSDTEIYIISGFYLSSERETHGHVERMEHLSTLAETIMVPKGYKFINVFDVSTAVSFDTAGQSDGMHLLGPTMKMIITKVFHHLCKDVVEGQRL